MLRVLLCDVVGLLVAAPSARADKTEGKAAAAVEKLKWTVTPDPKLPGKPVVTVPLSLAKVRDADLKELAGLKNLTALYLSFTDVTDEGLKDLTGFKNPTTLDLDGARGVTERGGWRSAA